MITTNGRIQQLKLAAGKSPRFADQFVVGISNAVLPTSASSLDFAWASAQVMDAYVDSALEQVVFYGTLDAALAGDIKEVGLVSQSDEFIKTGLSSSLVYTFDASEAWSSDVTFAISTASSIGLGNYKLTNVVVDNYLAKQVDGISLSRYDTLKLKLNSTAVTSVRVIVKNDELNYAYKDVAVANGDNLLTHTIASFTKFGSFSPQGITEVRLVVKTVSNSTNSIEFDALTFSSQANGGLVARSVLATPIYKRTGAGMEFEYAVAL